MEAAPRRLLLLPALLGTLLAGCTQRIAVPVAVPEEDPSEAWKALLEEAVSKDGVDYEHIAAHRQTLDAFVAWNSAHGPSSDEMRESHEDRRISFLVNAYNAAVIQGVLEHWPLDSVRDVDVGIYRVPGSGFFYGQRFRIDGEWISLHDLEQMLIVGRYQEPLLHAALNCASKGCPELRYFESKNLQSQLTRAMRAFLSSEQGLRPLGESPDDGFAASQIFSWYRDDFLDWSDAPTVCAWMVDYTSGARRKWLAEHAQGCPLQSFEYDWGLNHAPRDERRGKAMPTLVPGLAVEPEEIVVPAKARGPDEDTGSGD